MRAHNLILAGLVALGATACQVRTAVSVDVADDGSGTVEVAVQLDREAVARLPDVDRDGRSAADDLAALLRTDDLRDAGWEVEGPAPDGGGAVVTVTKPFGTPEEAEHVLAEVAGRDGPLRDLRVERDDGFGRARFRFTGTADLGGGLEVFGDAAMAAALGGEPLGQDAAAIERELGRPLAEMFTLEVTADLPGDGGAGNAWRPVLGGPTVEMEATGTVWDWPVVALAALAGACAASLVVLVAVRVVARRARTSR